MKDSLRVYLCYPGGKVQKKVNLTYECKGTNKIDSKKPQFNQIRGGLYGDETTKRNPGIF